jgi:curved DNA-binding protein CbpA
MTADDQAPDWRLLPHDPQAFFALPDEFDRKDLKRAYNRFLRQFKPEKHPAEFQRIRAAFEALDNRLRYGESLADLSQFAVTLQQFVQQSGDAESPGRRSGSTAAGRARPPAAAPRALP